MRTSSIRAHPVITDAKLHSCYFKFPMQQVIIIHKSGDITEDQRLGLANCHYLKFSDPMMWCLYSI